MSYSRNLCENPGNIDRVDGRDLVGRIDRFVGKEAFQKILDLVNYHAKLINRKIYLAVVKSAVNA